VLVPHARELDRPAGAADDRAVFLDAADDEDLLAAAHHVPERLQHAADHAALGAVGAVEAPRDVDEAHVAGRELARRELVGAAGALLLVAVEGEVHLVHAPALGGLAEHGLRTASAAGVQGTFGG